MTLNLRLKVCCISSSDEARIAVAAGAHALGLVSAMPSGPGPISEELIAEITRTVPPGVDTFLLTCRSDAAGIIDQLRRTGCRTVQLVDAVEPGTYAAIRRELPNVKIVQVIHVQDRGALAEAREAEPHVDASCSTAAGPTRPSRNWAAPDARTTGQSRRRWCGRCGCRCSSREVCGKRMWETPCSPFGHLGWICARGFEPTGDSMQQSCGDL